MTIKNAGYEAIIINNNPETVSTDYTTADKLYFEPLTPEDVMNIIEFEKPDGVITSLGGQTAINLAEPLMKRGVKIIGTDCDAIERAENRDSFEKVLKSLKKVPGLNKLENTVKKYIGSTDYKNASPIMRQIMVSHTQSPGKHPSMPPLKYN